MSLLYPFNFSDTSDLNHWVSVGAPSMLEASERTLQSLVGAFLMLFYYFQVDQPTPFEPIANQLSDLPMRWLLKTDQTPKLMRHQINHERCHQSNRKGRHACDLGWLGRAPKASISFWFWLKGVEFHDVCRHFRLCTKHPTTSAVEARSAVPSIIPSLSWRYVWAKGSLRKKSREMEAQTRFFWFD